MRLHTENISFVPRADWYVVNQIHQSIQQVNNHLSLQQTQTFLFANKYRVKVLNLPSQVERKECGLICWCYKIYHSSFAFVEQIKASTHSPSFHLGMWNLALTTWIRNTHRWACQNQSSKLSFTGRGICLCLLITFYVIAVLQFIYSYLIACKLYFSSAFHFLRIGLSFYLTTKNRLQILCQPMFQSVRYFSFCKILILPDCARGDVCRSEPLLLTL